MGSGRRQENRYNEVGCSIGGRGIRRTDVVVEVSIGSVPTIDVHGLGLHTVDLFGVDMIPATRRSPLPDKEMRS